MIRLLGVLLIFSGGGGMALLTVRRQQRELDTIAELLYALHRMEREIRTDGRALREIFLSLAAEETGETERFWYAALKRWQEEPEQALSHPWESACAELSLSEEGLRIWRELGRRLVGDGESVEKGIHLATEELMALQLQLKQEVPGQRRVVTALSLCGAAILSVLLL